MRLPGDVVFGVAALPMACGFLLRLRSIFRSMRHDEVRQRPDIDQR